MTRTAAADAVMSACPRTAAPCPSAAGTAIASIGLAPKGRGTPRPGRARPPFLRHLPGPPYRPELSRVRLLHRPPSPGDAATFAGWPADPGRDI
jgi:hypothetical protein